MRQFPSIKILATATLLSLATITGAQGQLTDTLHTSAKSSEMADSLSFKAKAQALRGKVKQGTKTVVTKAGEELEEAGEELKESTEKGVGKERRAGDEHKDANKCDCDPQGGALGPRKE